MYIALFRLVALMPFTKIQCQSFLNFETLFERHLTKRDHERFLQTSNIGCHAKSVYYL